MTKKVVTFGEIMMRLSPPAFLRFAQADTFNVIYGGGEANVAVSLANFGIPADFVTRLPKNDLGNACLGFLRKYGVGTDKIIRGGDRLGIYFAETGAMQRGSKVIYDRTNSSIATIETGMVDWDKVFKDAGWFHWTGITPAVSSGAASVCLEAVKKAKSMNLTVSCDLNYRGKLWKWGKKASEVMPELVSYSDIAIGNEEDAEKAFGIKAAGADVTAGKVSAENYRPVVEELKKRFPKLKLIGITLRGSISASHNTWSGLLYDGKKLYTAPVYQVTHIVDRIGGGDSFCGAFIYGMLTFGEDLNKVLKFAVGAACLKHTVVGDFNMVSVAEVEKLIKGDVSGRVSR
jgi:2-dehydro-3-deoxygluconokinase